MNTLLNAEKKVMLVQLTKGRGPLVKGPGTHKIRGTTAGEEQRMHL